MWMSTMKNFGAFVNFFSVMVVHGNNLHVTCILMCILQSMVYPEEFKGQDSPRIIVQYRKELRIPKVPEFLSSRTHTFLCRGRDNAGRDQLWCGGDFILPECVCTYHHVANEEYHDYTACRSDDQMDSIKHMNCEQCKDFSVDYSGPCLNGGTINCGTDILAADVTCSCLPGFSGRFCEYQNIT
ncbi:uncharacterized protein LOC134279325, partial [Saccostrea cucullata]|uniref:uncharacterized protein LOC134279325 n=1 Tax=Saccostrea cuccullata TaxID=36930 RepID=UPI002ED55CA8